MIFWILVNVRLNFMLETLGQILWEASYPPLGTTQSLFYISTLLTGQLADTDKDTIPGSVFHVLFVCSEYQAASFTAWFFHVRTWMGDRLFNIFITKAMIKYLQNVHLKWPRYFQGQRGQLCAGCIKAGMLSMESIPFHDCLSHLPYPETICRTKPRYLTFVAFITFI